MDWTSLIIIVLIGGYPRPSRRFVLVIIPARPRRHGLNRLAVFPALPRPPYLGVIILARTEQLRGDEATVVTVILAENPCLGRAGEHEHGCAHEKNPFHDAPVLLAAHPRVLRRSPPAAAGCRTRTHEPREWSQERLLSPPLLSEQTADLSEVVAGLINLPPDRLYVRSNPVKLRNDRTKAAQQLRGRPAHLVAPFVRHHVVPRLLGHRGACAPKAQGCPPGAAQDPTASPPEQPPTCRAAPDARRGPLPAPTRSARTMATAMRARRR